MITRIQIAGLRGKSFDIQLDKVNLIVGANTAGKTTIGDAIKWGLLGTIPGMSVPPRGWADLLKDSAASVELTLEGDKTIVRSMMAQGGGVKMMAQGGSVRMQDVGTAGDVNVLALDPDRFFNETGPKRAQMVAEASRYDGFDWQGMVPGHLAASAKHAKSWAGWIAKELDDCKAKLSDFAAQKKMYTQTLRGLESMRDIVVEDDTEKKQKLDKMKEQLGRLKQTMQAVEDQIANAKRPRARSDAQVQLDRVLSQLQDYVGWTHDAETVEAREKANAAAIAKLGKKGAVSADTITTLTHAQSQESLTLNTLQARLAQVELTLEAIGAKYARTRKGKCCPICGTAGAAFAAAIAKMETEEAAPYAKQKLDVKGEILVHEAALDKASEALDKAQAVFNRQNALEDERQKLIVERRLIGLWEMHEQLVKQIQAETIPLDLSGLEERKYEIECDADDLLEAIEAAEHEVEAIAYQRGQKRKMQEVETALSAAEGGWLAANAQANELDLLRQRFTAMTLTPILETLAVFTAGIFTEPVTLEGTELGRMIGSKWVPLTQFSGAEQAVAMAGLTCALRTGSAENIVIVDEMGSFDDEHLAQFMKNVQRAVAEKRLAQFVGLSTPRKTVIKGATTIRI